MIKMFHFYLANRFTERLNRAVPRCDCRICFSQSHFRLLFLLCFFVNFFSALASVNHAHGASWLKCKLTTFKILRAESFNHTTPIYQRTYHQNYTNYYSKTNNFSQV